jgi:hypothetical protein
VDIQVLAITWKHSLVTSPQSANANGSNSYESRFVDRISQYFSSDVSHIRIGFMSVRESVEEFSASQKGFHVQR